MIINIDNLGLHIFSSRVMRKFQGFIEKFAPLLIVVNLSISAMVGVLAVQRYMGLQLNPFVGLPLMGVVFAIYILNRFTDLEEDLANSIGKSFFFVRYKKFYQIGIAAFIVSSSLMIFKNFTILKLQLTSLGIIVGMLYSYRIIPWYVKGKGLILYRIKEITLVKNLVISSFWTGAIFLMPILFTDTQVAHKITIYFLFGSLFILTFSSTLFGDIRDEKGDRLAGINTIPALWGKEKSYIFWGCISLLWLIILGYFYNKNYFDFNHLIFMILISLYPLIYLIPYQLKLSSQITMDFLCDLDLWVFSAGLSMLSFNIATG